MYINIEISIFIMSEESGIIERIKAELDSGNADYSYSNRAGTNEHELKFPDSGLCVKLHFGDELGVRIAGKFGHGIDYARQDALVEIILGVLNGRYRETTRSLEISGMPYSDLAVNRVLDQVAIKISRRIPSCTGYHALPEEVSGYHSFDLSKAA